MNTDFLPFFNPLPEQHMFNEAYAADISKKVRAQQNQAMRDGEFVGARPPYGYKKDPDNCHRLLVNEDTAPIVRQIFQWAVDGVPLNVIVKRLNEGGIMPPGYYHASCGLFSFNSKLAGSGKWQTWTVGKILDSEVYTGDMVQGKHTNIGHKQVVTAPENWIVVLDTHEAIISRELFAKAQAVREQTAKKGKTRAAKVPYTENILRGRVFCGCCGKNLHRQRHQCGYYLYHCISNDRIGKGACAAKVYVRESDLFSTIVAIIRQKAEVVMGEALRLRQCDSRIAARKANVDKEISELQRQTVKNKDLRAGLYLTAYLGDMELMEAAQAGAMSTKIKEVDVTGKDGTRQKKAIIKGAWLHMYPPGFNIYRTSRGIKRPTVSTMTEGEAQKLVNQIPLTYEKTISLTDSTGEVKNIINYRTYTKGAKLLSGSGQEADQ